MATEKFNFIKSKIDGLPAPPKGKRVYYYDTKTRGLAVCVTDSGGKTFYVYRRVNGKPERVRLGPYPDLTIEQARRMADDTNGAIARGENPNAKKRQAKAEMTVATLFEKYMEVHAKPNKKSWKSDQDQFDRYLTDWAKRKLSTVKKDDVRELHATVGKDHGIYAANRLLALVRKLFNFAKDHELFDRENPAQGIKLFKEQSRERRLFGHELPAFFAALAEEPNDTIRDYILISLLTGARRANVLSMTWNQISFERAIWSIPETKNGTPQSVPLTETAVDILKRRQAASTSPFVFPGPGKSGHLTEPKKGWARILERAGLEDLRLHDLRRTLGSWQVDTGASLAVVGKTLNHKSPTTTAIYARLDVDPVRQSMEKATEAMLKAGGLAIPGTTQASADVPE